MVRLITYHDQDALAAPDARTAPDALAGLVWTCGKQAGPLTLRRDALALTWADRRAGVPEEAGYPGKASLLSCLTAGLSEEDRRGRVICAAADDSQSLFFAAVLVGGKPALGAERLFETRQELIAHVDAECRSNQIDRLATSEDLAHEIDAPVPVSLFAYATSGFDPIRVEGKLTPQAPLWQLAAVGCGGLALAGTVAVILLSPFQTSKPVAATPVTPVHTALRDEDAFARNCLAAFADTWPISPGWQLASEGCATPEMRDPEITALDLPHAVAYRIWQPRPGFDAAIARKAAEAVYAGSAIDIVIRGNRLFTSAQIAVPMLEVNPDRTDNMTDPLTGPALLGAAEAVFLGLADSITLQTGGDLRVRITLKAGFDEVFERMARIEGAGIARIARKGETVTLEITPRRIVTLAQDIAEKKNVERHAAAAAGISLATAATPTDRRAATRTAPAGAPRAATLADRHKDHAT